MRSRITESELLAWNPLRSAAPCGTAPIGSVVLPADREEHSHPFHRGRWHVRPPPEGQQGTHRSRDQRVELCPWHNHRREPVGARRFRPAQYRLLAGLCPAAAADAPHRRGHVARRPRQAHGRRPGIADPRRSAAVCRGAERAAGEPRPPSASSITVATRSRPIRTRTCSNRRSPISGPLIRQIQDATEAVVRELASGIQMGPLGFEIVQHYPLRVIKEAITNAVIHRDYHLMTDVHIRIFSDRIELESPGLFAGPVTAANIGRDRGLQPQSAAGQPPAGVPQPAEPRCGRRGPHDVRHDAGDGPVSAPLRYTPPHGAAGRACQLFNENRPSLWEQVSDYIDRHGSIGNAEVRQLMGTEDVLAVSKLIREWVDRGQLVVTNPRPDQSPAVREARDCHGESLFSNLER